MPFKKGHKAYTIPEKTINRMKVQSSIRMTKKNPMSKIETRKKVSGTIKKRWQEGFYANRVNGMTGKTKWYHNNYTGHKWTYSEFLSQFQDISKCSLCGRTSKINVHHIDENHNNWLLTNLIPICNVCHQQFHFKRYITPFVTVGKQFRFCSAHHLIEYTGKCQFKHGHEYEMWVYVRRRIDSKTGMVIDYADLKEMFLQHIDKIVDHKDLNDVTDIGKTTAENLLIWFWRQLEEKALLKGLVKLELHETTTSYASITIEDMLEYRKQAEKLQQSNNIYI